MPNHSGPKRHQQRGGSRFLRRVTCAAAMAGTMLLSTLALAGVDTPAGHVWKTIDDETGEEKSYVQIIEINGKLYGKVVKLLQQPDARCEKCDGDRKDKPIMGMTILWGLAKDGDAWGGGKIYDPKKGKEYRAKMWIEGDKLMVRGYLGPIFRTQTWHLVR